MNDSFNSMIGRREVLRVLTRGAAAAAASTTPIGQAVADSFTQEQTKKPRYRVTPDVEAFYRVNRY